MAQESQLKKSWNEKDIQRVRNKILIDDREDTILDWKSKNGIGILYKGDTQETIRQLKHYGI